MLGVSKRRWVSPLTGSSWIWKMRLPSAKRRRRAPVVAGAFDKPRSGKLYVRVNALGTEWCYGDITAVVRAGLDGIVLPKVEHAHELRTADWLIGALERERGLPAGAIDLIPIIETALGVSNLAGNLPIRHANEAAGLRSRGFYAGYGHGVVAIGNRTIAVSKRLRSGIPRRGVRAAVGYRVGGSAGS